MNNLNLRILFAETGKFWDSSNEMYSIERLHLNKKCKELKQYIASRFKIQEPS